MFTSKNVYSSPEKTFHSEMLLGNSTDLSVVLFRSDCKLVSEGHPMKMHKNQWLSNLLSPTDIPYGATHQGTPSRGWGAGASAVPREGTIPRAIVLQALENKALSQRVTEKAA